MSEPWERLRKARAEAGYASGADAALALGVSYPTYMHHENGTNGMSRTGERYARFFRVNLEWLLTGRGPMRGEARGVPVMGYVGAGAVVDPVGNLADAEFPDSVEMPGTDGISALIVRGDSQVPRFLPGEAILYNTTPLLPEVLSGNYAVVQTEDGRVLVKILRPGPNGHWLLESHNAPAEAARVLAAYEITTIIPRRGRVETTKTVF